MELKRNFHYLKNNGLKSNLLYIYIQNIMTQNILELQLIEKTLTEFQKENSESNITPSQWIYLLKVKIAKLEHENDFLNEELDMNNWAFNEVNHKLRKNMYMRIDFLNEIKNKDKVIKQLEKKVKPSFLQRLFRK